MKVAFVITSLATGGAEIMLLKTLERIDPRFSPHVFCLTGLGEVGPRIRALGIPVETFGMTGIAQSSAVLYRLVRRLNELRPDLVHTWMYHADLLGGIAARASGVPAVVWGLRSSDFITKATPFSTRAVVRLCAWLSRYIPDCVQSCSQKGAEVHQAMGYRKNIFHVIPNGVNLERFRPDPAARSRFRGEIGIDDDVPLIGLIGRFDYLKNHKGFVEAAALLHSRRPDARFVLVGQEADWSNRQLVGWIEERCLVAAFHLLGRRDDIPAITASLDIASLASLSEGFPNVLIEAMACGVLCVATDSGDSAMILNGSGWIVPVGDMCRLAQTWEELLAKPHEERIALSRRARERVVREFDQDSVVRRYEKLYLDIHIRKVPAGSRR